MIDWDAVTAALHAQNPAAAEAVEAELRAWASGAPAGAVFGSPRRWALARRDALLREYASLLPDAGLDELRTIATRFCATVAPRYRSGKGPPEGASLVHRRLWESSQFGAMPDSERQWRRILGDRAKSRNEK